MDAFSFFLISMATWRAACIITQEDGPAMLCFRFRQRLITRWPAPGGVGELVSCPFCTSVWLGAIATLAWLIAPAATIVIALPLAIAGVAAAIERLLGGTEDESDQPSSLVD